MANLKLVGAVAIKVRPDADGFRRETQRQVDKELAGYSAKVKVEAKVHADTSAARTEIERFQQETEHKIFNLKVGLDHDSVRRAQEQLNAAIKNHQAEHIKVDLDDPADVEAKLEELRRRLESAPVEVKFHADEAGFRSVLAKIEEIRRERLEEEISFSINEDGPDGLRETEAEIRRRLGEEKITLAYDLDEASLAATRAKLKALLGDGHKQIQIETTLDDFALLEQLARVDALILEENRKKIRIETEMNAASVLGAATVLNLLTRNRTVTITARLRDLTFLTAAKLTGLRAVTRWTEEFGRAVGTLDRNLPILAAATLLISQLSSGILTLTADMFSLGNGLGQVIRGMALLAPAMLLGLGSVMIVMLGVFKDFGAAVHGIDAALKRLPPAGQEAARKLRPIFADIRQTVTENFWDRASDAMLRFVNSALPAVGAGLGKLAGSLGQTFGTILDSFTRLAQSSGISVFFSNLSRGFTIAGPGFAAFFDAFNKLAVIGSTVFIRMGTAFNDMSADFKDWTDRVSADGSLKRWIDEGIQGLKDLFNAGGSLVRVWGNIGRAAENAGALTLSSFAAMLDRWDQVTNSARFQKNMKLIFEGAREASDTFHKALGSLGPAMDTFSVTIKHTLSNAGAALGAFVRLIGDVISSPLVDRGLTTFLTGLRSMFESLRPAAAPIAEIIATLGSVLGQVATDSGPLFRDLFFQLSGAFKAAWSALQPFIPGLVSIGQTVVNIVGPALSNIASTVIPAFAESLTKIGVFLLPVVDGIAFLAEGFAKLTTVIPLPFIAQAAAVILSMGTAMSFARALIGPLAEGLAGLGAVSAVTAIRMQLLVPVIGLALAALSGLIAFGVTALATSQGNATPFAEEYATALREDAKAAGELGAAIGEATTKVAIHELAISGAFEAAQRLGISNTDLINGLLHGGPVMDDINKKINGATTEYDDASAAAKRYASGGLAVFNADGLVTGSTKERGDAAKKLNGILDIQGKKLQGTVAATNAEAEALKAAGIGATDTGTALDDFAKKAGLSADNLNAAANATATLSSAFSSGPARIDAMRKSLDLLIGPNTKQKVEDATGAYVKGFLDLQEAAKAVAPEIKKLGTAAYGQGGFLNVASGNAAVLQVNQSLIDFVNNTWAAAKVIYDNTLKETGNAQRAFVKAQEFINGTAGKKFTDGAKARYDQLVKDSGLSADKVQGQWDALFSKEWALKVTFEGATEAAVKAQAMFGVLHAKFDGQKFQMFLDANPDEAIKAVQGLSDQVALDWVNHEWQAKFKAAPQEAQDTLTQLLNSTNEQWTEGDFTSILKVAQKIPGLSEALLQIFNGVNQDWRAVIFALVNGISLDEAKRRLDAIAARRTAVIDVVVRQLATPDFVPRGGQRVPTSDSFAANGSIMDAYGRGLAGFNPRYFANGGFSENHVAQISRANGPIRIWGERETGGEAYLPMAASKRPRSVQILGEVARRFGYDLSKAQKFANGSAVTQGASNPVGTPHTSVTVGTINTVDPETAVRKLRTMQRDALAVAGII